MCQERCPSTIIKGNAKGKGCGAFYGLEIEEFELLPGERADSHINLQLWLLCLPPQSLMPKVL